MRYEFFFLIVAVWVAYNDLHPLHLDSCHIGNHTTSSYFHVYIVFSWIVLNLQNKVHSSVPVMCQAPTGFFY